MLLLVVGLFLETLVSAGDEGGHVSGPIQRTQSPWIFLDLVICCAMVDGGLVSVSAWLSMVAAAAGYKMSRSDWDH